MVEEAPRGALPEKVALLQGGTQVLDEGLLITEGVVSREEGLAFADSPTNLMWRLQNDLTPQTRLIPKTEEVEEGATFTEIMLDAPN